jgi:Anaphase-promoting complex subunit 5
MLNEHAPACTRQHYLSYPSLTQVPQLLAEWGVSNGTYFTSEILRLLSQRPRIVSLYDFRAPLQYVALNLASLYAQLNYKQEALESVMQAIPLARDSNDQECLSYLLCWLQQLGTNSHSDTSPSDWEMLQSLSARTKNLNQHSLQVTCELGKAKWLFESNKGGCRLDSRLIWFMAVYQLQSL